MRFSIIIPAYNSSEYIIKGLDSIKNQSFTDYELIVICDSCIDNTESIAKSYGAITRAVQFHKEGLTKNIGLDIAKGEYILFMDDDDWFLHEFVLEMLDAKLREEDDPDILCFSFIFKGVGYAKPKRSCGEYWIATWNKAWKREIIGDTRFPNIFSVSDSYFQRDMGNKKARTVMWDMPLYYYNYLRESSISQKCGNTYKSTKKWI